MKKFLSATKGKLGYVAGLVMIGASNMQTALASSSLFDGTDTKANLLVEKFCKAYRTWSIPFILAAGILWALTKDEKKKEIEKRACITMMILFVLTYLVSFITQSLSDIGGVLDGTIT